jgi:23S rRNA pseudouridine955/2504/2580 synthase
MLIFTTAPDDAGRRLDRVLRKALPVYKLSFIYKLFREKKIRVNDEIKQIDYRLVLNDVIKIDVKQNDNIGNIGNDEPQNAAAKTQGQALTVIYEDDDFLVINKNSGDLVHGENGLDKTVLYYLRDKPNRSAGRSISFRPGPLHRLDRPTSGILVFGKTLFGSQFFSNALQQGAVKKIYWGIVKGLLRSGETWRDELVRDKTIHKTFVANDLVIYNQAINDLVINDLGINDINKTPPSKLSITGVKPLLWGEGRTLCEFTIDTGRTHQIRAQAAAHGFVLQNDKKYGAESARGGDFFLHAKTLSVNFEGRLFEWTAPLPPRFEHQIKHFRKTIAGA